MKYIINSNFYRIKESEGIVLFACNVENSCILNAMETEILEIFVNSCDKNNAYNIFIDNGGQVTKKHFLDIVQKMIDMKILVLEK